MMETWRRSELMQLERVMSMMRYWPAKGTAGLARLRVRGKSRSPAPPASSTLSVSLMFVIYLRAKCNLTYDNIRAIPEPVLATEPERIESLTRGDCFLRWVCMRDMQGKQRSAPEVRRAAWKKKWTMCPRRRLLQRRWADPASDRLNRWL